VVESFDLADVDPLNLLAVEVVAGPSARPIPSSSGLADELFEHDGQITKREVRALTLSSLAPAPGELLWDVGLGSGSVAIEWMLAHPTCRAIGIERDGERANRAVRNAIALGVPQLSVVRGAAPEVLRGLAVPDAIFIGGGGAGDGVIELCWQALKPGGRIVANSVTLESEGLLVAVQAKYGGSLTRISVERAEPIGSKLGWRPAMPVVQWVARKPGAGS
jgi:precorrin-6Y C5,15-methyltransferase (decarboxylating)